MPKPLMLALAALTLSACSDRPSPPPANDSSDESRRVETGYEQSVDRAREVEGDVLEAAERQKQAIEEQTGDG